MIKQQAKKHKLSLDGFVDMIGLNGYRLSLTAKWLLFYHVSVFICLCIIQYQDDNWLFSTDNYFRNGEFNMRWCLSILF
eukprot:UN26457